jgi:hypothetical protein
MGFVVYETDLPTKQPITEKPDLPPSLRESREHLKQCQASALPQRSAVSHRLAQHLQWID